MNDKSEQRVPLGKSGVSVSPIGVGTWAWGESSWGFRSGYDEADLRDAFNSSLSAGIDFFDTAEVYGGGDSERFIGRFIRETGRSVVVATKFAPHRMRAPGFTLRSALRGSLRRLSLESVDLYQIHWHAHFMVPAILMRQLASAARDGLIRAIGVSNYSPGQMIRAQTLLGRYGGLLATNQVEYNLLNRDPERNGLLAECRRYGITLIAYSPLAMGLLTGAYSSSRPPPGFRGRRYGTTLTPDLDRLLGLMKEIGRGRGGKTIAQVALNWIIAKGAIPIPGVKNHRQVSELAGALGWMLSEEEMTALDNGSAVVQRAVF